MIYDVVLIPIASHIITCWQIKYERNNNIIFIHIF